MGDDPARIEELFVAAVHRAAIDVELEERVALDEERAPLLEERLERRQVQHGWIRLDLTEVGIGRPGKGQVRRDGELDVGPHREPLVSPEAVARRRRDILRDHVRCDLGPLRSSEAVEPGEVAELRHEAGMGHAVQRPAALLSGALDRAPDGHPEGDVGRRGVTQLRKRQPEFRGPAERINPGGHIPDAIPGNVLIGVLRDGVVGLDAHRVHREFIPRPSIVVGIDHHRELVRWRADIAPREQPHDAVGVRIERADEDVQVVRVEQHPRLGAELRLRALRGPDHTKAADHRRAAPGNFVVAPVDHRRPRGAPRRNVVNLGGDDRRVRSILRG
jgi:hypothetical protein